MATNNGIGGKTIDEALGGLSDMTSGVAPIQKAEFEQRLRTLQSELKNRGARAVRLTQLSWQREAFVACHVTPNLVLPPGLHWFL